uniref:ABC transporter substrate-binding protein n=1 Tax=uncultured Bilophila sp. TaxID=529385 RepID=UPI00280BE76F
AIIMKQARELGATFVLMGGDAMDNPDTVKIAGKAAEGFMQTAFPYDMTMKDMNAQAKAFTEAWKKNFPDKDPNVNATLGYTCYDMIIDALNRAGKADREAVTKALAETKDLATPVGIMTINATHDAEIPVGILKYENGKRIYAGEIVPE